MKIRLDEISEEGREYTLTRASGELNEILSDLTEADYQVEVKLRPLESYYEVQGHLTTRVSESCARCGFDIEMPLRRDFNDIVIEKPQDPRGSHYSRGHQLENVPKTEVFYHIGGLFNLGEYIHELIALEWPEYASCGDQDCPHLQETNDRLEKLNDESKSFDQKAGGHPGFKALEGLKIH